MVFIDEKVVDEKAADEVVVDEKAADEFVVDEVIEEEKVDVDMNFLLQNRVHYGRKTKTRFSESFIYKVHPRGFFLIDLTITIEKLKSAAKFMANYKPEKILICSAREYAVNGINKMCDLTGMSPKAGRFLPGTLTNHILKGYQQADLILVVDHNYDSQAVQEAVKMKIPVISFVDTNSFPSLVDFTIPANSKGRVSLAALFWSLTVLYLREKNILAFDEIIDVPLDDFIVPLE